MLNRLNENQHEAYVVGGCVRDSIMGITPHDWDICTSAKPEQVIELFSDCNVLKTGLQHGTVTIMVDKKPYEVTTYRIDGEYKDSRHPESVEFVDDLFQDLMRRDFTINAMAYNPATGLIDYFNGVDDIESKYLRCVGNPDERFKEDALRILRAIRFASRFGFEISLRTNRAISENMDLLQNISKERVQQEIEKIASCENLSVGSTFHLVKAVETVLPWYLMKAGSPKTQRIIDAKDQKARLAILFDFVPEVTREVMRELKFSNCMIDSVIEVQITGRWLIEQCKTLHKLGYPNIFQNMSDKADFITRQLMFGRPHDICNSIWQYFRVNVNDASQKFIDELSESAQRVAKQPVMASLKSLKVNGNDMKNLSYTGREIGDILKRLALMVQSGAVRNMRYDLLKVAKIIKDGAL